MGDLNAQRGIEDHTLYFDNHISQLLPDTKFNTRRKSMLL